MHCQEDAADLPSSDFSQRHGLYIDRVGLAVAVEVATLDAQRIRRWGNVNRNEVATAQTFVILTQHIAQTELH